MKRNFKFVLLATLIGIVGACGKKNSSGDKSWANSIASNANLSQSSADALRNFQEWYNSASEGGSPGTVGNFRLTYQTSTASYGNGCQVRDIEIFGEKIGEWYDCSNINSGTNGSLTDCRVTVTTNNRSLKPQNPTLLGIMNSSLGTIVNATQSGTRFNIQVQRSNGYVVNYVIDTNYHSAFQPIQSSDTETGRVKYLYNFTNYNVSPSLPACN